MSNPLKIGTLKSVLREAKVKKNVKHPNILSVFKADVVIAVCESALYYAEQSKFIADSDDDILRNLYHNLKKLTAENEELKNRDNVTYLADDNDKLRALLLNICSSKGWPCNFHTLTGSHWTCGDQDEKCGVCKAAEYLGIRLGKEGYYDPKEGDSE